MNFTPAESEFNKDNILSAAIKVPFELKERLIFVKGKINSDGPYTFILDTGSAEVLLLPDVATALKLDIKSMAGYENVWFTNLRSFSMGDAHAYNLPTVIRAIPEDRYARYTYDGIIGTPFLSNFTVSVNYKDSVLILVPYNTDERKKDK